MHQHRRLLRPDTDEAAEQRQSSGHGGGGGKGPDQGEHDRAKRAPDPEPDWRVQCARSCTSSSSNTEGDAVHGAPPPRQHRATPFGIPGTQAGGSAGRRWRDVGAIRRAAGGQPPGPARTIAPRSVSGEAVAASVHPKDGRAATAARHRRAGGQAGPTRGRRGAQCHLRVRLPRVLLWLPTGRSQHDALDALAVAILRREGELGARCRHPWFLRRHRPRVAGEVSSSIGLGTGACCGSSRSGWPQACWKTGRGQPSEVGSPQGRPISPAAGQPLPALRLRPVGPAMEEDGSARRADRRALLRRLHRRISAPFAMPSSSRDELRERSRRSAWSCTPTRRGSIAFGRFARSNRRARGLRGESRRPSISSGSPTSVGRSRTGEFLLLRQTDAEADDGEAARGHRPNCSAAAISPSRSKALAGAVVRGHFAYYGVPDQHPCVCAAFRTSIARSGIALCGGGASAQRINWARMSSARAARWLPPARITHPWPSSASTSEPEARAQCGSPARWDLCGGRPEPLGRRAVPTATQSSSKSPSRFGTPWWLRWEWQSASAGGS